jgi:hypothetical protein
VGGNPAMKIEKMKNLIKKVFRWICQAELERLENTIKEQENYSVQLKEMIGNIDVAVDVHQYGRSWAVVCIQGERTDYVKFIDLHRS